MKRLQPTMRRAKTQLNQWWTLRSPREQNLIRLCAYAVTLLCIWIIAVCPAISTIKTTSDVLPRLRQDAAVVRSIAMQAQNLAHSILVPGVQVSDMEAALQNSLRLANLSTTVSIQTEHTTNVYLLRVNEAPARDFLDWLLRSSRALEFSVQALTLERPIRSGKDISGLVTGTVELRVQDKS